MKTQLPLASCSIFNQTHIPVGQVIVWKWERRGARYITEFEIDLQDGPWWDVVTKAVSNGIAQFNYEGDLIVALVDRVEQYPCKCARDVAIVLANFFESIIQGKEANVA